MRDAYVPWPRFDRRTLLLLLDDQQRLLLCGSCCRGWTVPEIRLGSNTDFLGEANRFLTERFGLPRPPLSGLYGLHQTGHQESWQYDRTTASRAYIARVSDTQSATWQEAGPSHTRWGPQELKRRRREISPEGVVLLATGYIEGWLPDGPLGLS
ncbi:MULTISPECIES: hypothetical protein [Streptomyces]|nr:MULTISPECIES: hypothetical protein [Streptomyces]WSU74206.1 hypothetical protein OG499_15150 [Streptomyces anulatus]WTD10467.1 hypothetical protein OHA54_14975 [Streptomyces anulatus]WTD27440.1 hypothetical protein OH737_24285 [Streptomyces anulatus]WTE03772.1 hypothetical protein OH765_15075 [Streptomyces anulatus]